MEAVSPLLNHRRIYSGLHLHQGLRRESIGFRFAVSTEVIAHKGAEQAESAVLGLDGLDFWARCALPRPRARPPCRSPVPRIAALGIRVGGTLRRPQLVAGMRSRG